MRRSCDGRPVNLGTGRAVTIAELAERMIRLSGRRVAREAAPARAGDVAHSLADVTRAKRLLGWRPRVSLERGLAELVDPQTETLVSDAFGPSRKDRPAYRFPIRADFETLPTPRSGSVA